MADPGIQELADLRIQELVDSAPTLLSAADIAPAHCPREGRLMGVARDHGAAAEDLAAAYVALLGWELAARNTRLAGVEVDLLAREGRTWILVEVKYRARSDFGGAPAAIDARKRERLRRAALAASGGRDDVRIDIVSIESSADGLVLTHHRNAITG